MKILTVIMTDEFQASLENMVKIKQMTDNLNPSFDPTDMLATLVAMAASHDRPYKAKDGSVQVLVAPKEQTNEQTLSTSPSDNP